MATKGRKTKKPDATPSLGQLMRQMLEELERRDAEEQREPVPRTR